MLLLADHFLKTHARAYQKPVGSFAPPVLDHLLRYDWPGNVRELENVIARCVILAKAEQVTVDDLPESIRNPLGPKVFTQTGGFLSDIPDTGIAIKDLERELISKTVAKCLGSKTRAAQLLGVSRKTLYEKLERYGL